MGDEGWVNAILVGIGLKLTAEQTEAIRESTSVQTDMKNLITQSATQTHAMINLTETLNKMTLVLIGVGILQVLLVFIQIFLILIGK
ncbi:MAG: hypothetical protein ABH983_04400 [Candidatus Micrarchaeota archaeon]